MKKTNLFMVGSLLVTLATLSFAESTLDVKICGCGCGRVLSSEEANNSAIIAGTCKCKACTLDTQKEEEKILKRQPQVDIQQSLEFSKKPLKKVKNRQILDGIDNIKLTVNHNLQIKQDRIKEYQLIHEKSVPNVKPKYPGSRKIEKSNTFEDTQPLDIGEIYSYSNIFKVNASCDPKAIPSYMEISEQNFNTASFGIDFSNNMIQNIFDNNEISSIINSHWDKLKIADVQRDSNFNMNLPEVTRILGHDCGKGFRGNRNEDERRWEDIPRQRFRVQPLRIRARIPIDLDTLMTLRHLN